MLQQTQVDRVIPYFLAFLERFPDVQALSGAGCTAESYGWAGRATTAAPSICNGPRVMSCRSLTAVFPERVSELVQLPGIGPYTAGAIACFAFERDVAFSTPTSVGCFIASSLASTRRNHVPRT